MSTSGTSYSLTKGFFAKAILSFLLVVSVGIPIAAPLVAQAQQMNPGNSGLPSATTPPQKPEGVLSGCTFSFSTSISTCLAGVIYFFFIGITSLIAPVAGYFFDFTTSIALTGGTYSSEFIANGWQIARDVANIAFVFLLIYLAFTLILDVAQTGVGKQLAKIIAVALLINFSFFFSRVIIDGSNILAHAFYDNIQGRQLNTQGFGASVGNAPITVITLSESILNGINVQRLFDPGPNGGGFYAFQKNLEKSDGTANFALLASIFIMMGIMNIILIFIFFVAGIQMIGRIVRLWLVIILAPIGFIMWIIPGLGSLSTRWWNTLWKNALFAPAFLLGIYLVIKLANGGILKGLSISPGASPTIESALIAVMFVTIRMAIVMGMLFGVLKMSEYFGQAGSKAIVSGAKRYGSTIGKYTGAGYGLSYGIGSTARGASTMLQNSRVGNSWLGYKFRQYAVDPLAKKQYFGAESAITRDARVNKERTERFDGKKSASKQQQVLDAYTQVSQGVNLTSEQERNLKSIVPTLSDAELKSIGPAALAPLGHMLKKAQVDGLEKNMKARLISPTAFTAIKTTYQQRTIGASEAPINQIDKMSKQLAEQEGFAYKQATDRNMSSLEGIAEMQKLFNYSGKEAVVGEGDIDNAITALNKRLDATQNDNNLRALREKTKQQIEQLGKMKEIVITLPASVGNNEARPDLDVIAAQYVPKVANIPAPPTLSPQPIASNQTGNPTQATQTNQGGGQQTQQTPRRSASNAQATMGQFPAGSPFVTQPPQSAPTTIVPPTQPQTGGGPQTQTTPTNPNQTPPPATP